MADLNPVRRDELNKLDEGRKPEVLSLLNKEVLEDLRIGRRSWIADFSGFHQYTPSAKLGDVGIGIVSRLVSEEFGWLFKRNHQEHDFGIDGQIEVVAGSVTGQMLACQIKCGISFFRESNKWGYVYRGEMKHFNYLANYPMPVIVVLCNPATQEAIWEMFQPNSARMTEGGWTITIPFENKLSTSKTALIKLLPPVSDHAAHLKEYWRINNMLLSVEHILFLVDREDVEGVNPKPTLDFLARLHSYEGTRVSLSGQAGSWLLWL